MDPLQAYIEPIRKKWIYHFLISPKTSTIDRPEWYFEKTRGWIYEHIDLVDNKVKFDQTKDSKCKHIKHKFIECMIELIMKRLTRDMKKVSDCINEDQHYIAILIHTYNEVIQFTKTIRRLLGPCFQTLDDKYDMLSVFANQDLFEKIVDIEWEHSEKHLKNINNMVNRWDPVLEGDFRDEFKIPTCVDRFLLLIQSITERVECFKQLDCQYKLIELQCYLFEKFLKFLKKSTSSSNKVLLKDILFFGNSSALDQTRMSRILNGIDFLRLVLKERTFIPIRDLDPSLSERVSKLAEECKSE